MILAKTREITGADAGSLYVVETRAANGNSGRPERRLRFKLTQNDSRQFPFAEYTLPLDEDSLAGYAALHGEVIALDDAYAVPRDRPYRFNPRYDEETGYRTRSLADAADEKCARRSDRRGATAQLQAQPGGAAADAGRSRPRSAAISRSARCAWRESLASQAAVAYENSRLYQDIEALFEGFVQAAVTAIEQRDPTTSGHSLRVSRMTVGLAEIVDRCDTGAYRDTRFTPDQMKEIRYAALLHDFGKVGVREEVLVKAKKLYPAQIRRGAGPLRLRAQGTRGALRAQRSSARCWNCRARRRWRRSPRSTRNASGRLAELDEAFAVIAGANEPTVTAVRGSSTGCSRSRAGPIAIRAARSVRC